MMSICSKEFNLCDFENQIELLLRNGKCVAKYTENYCHLLFSYGTYYVEVVYVKNGSKILSIHAFTDEEILQRYIEKVDISSVLYC